MTVTEIEPMQYRTVQVREVNTEKREVTGIAVPWGEVADIGGYYREIIERGAVVESDDALAFFLHGTPVGKLVRHEDTDAGWEVTLHLSETPTGDEAYTLARDGVLSHFSIGFSPIEHRDEIDEHENVTRTRTKIKVHEVSLVPFPAYKGATVSNVRSATQPDPTGEKPMPPETQFAPAADVDELRSTLSEMERRLAAAPTSTTVEEDQFRSFGEYVQAVARGDERALRAFEGAVVGDTILHDAWVGDVIKLMTQKQTVLGEFTKGALPATGMTVEYGKLLTDTTQVGEQAAEGDDLLFGKVSIGTDNAPVKTLGGWSSLSRQAIERSNVGILDTTFLALALKYARAVEMMTRQTVTAGLVTAPTLVTDFTTQDGIVASLLNIAEKFDDNDRILSGIFVAKDVFLSIYGVEATDRILQISQAPTDRVGTLTISSMEADLANIKVKVFPGLAAGTKFAYDGLAVKTLESPGAPLRLQDENVVNLTKDFSVYGYASSFVQVANGLLRLTTV